MHLKLIKDNAINWILVMLLYTVDIIFKLSLNTYAAWLIIDIIV